MSGELTIDSGNLDSWVEGYSQLANSEDDDTGGGCLAIIN